MEISAQAVKELREKTGAGMMDCKRALAESKGDLQSAVEVLRKRGLSIAAKKAGREASEGTIGAFVTASSTSAAIVEVNCETDFVAKNEDFQRFVNDLTKLIEKARPQQVDDLLQLKLGTQTVNEALTALIARIGENMGIRRLAQFTAKTGETVAHYMHAGNKIGVLVLLANPNDKLDQARGKEVAMHIAAMRPRYIRSSDVPSDTIEKEKEIIRAQLAGEKKPPEILEKIVSGKLTRFYSESCLEDQIFVCDPEGKRSVAAVLKAIDAGIRIQKFVRYQVGETF